MRYWCERYDAELTTFAGDVAELRVGRPPLTRDDSIVLAREQFVYRQDIVTQGTETLEELAAGLLASPVWFFWRD
jgi:hypothetical protein